MRKKTGTELNICSFDLSNMENKSRYFKKIKTATMLVSLHHGIGFEDLIPSLLLKVVHLGKARIDQSFVLILIALWWSKCCKEAAWLSNA